MISTVSCLCSGPGPLLLGQESNNPSGARASLAVSNSEPVPLRLPPDWRLLHHVRYDVTGGWVLEHRADGTEDALWAHGVRNQRLPHVPRVLGGRCISPLSKGCLPYLEADRQRHERCQRVGAHPISFGKRSGWDDPRSRSDVRITDGERPSEAIRRDHRLTLGCGGGRESDSLRRGWVERASYRSPVASSPAYSTASANRQVCTCSSLALMALASPPWPRGWHERARERSLGMTTSIGAPTCFRRLEPSSQHLRRTRAAHTLGPHMAGRSQSWHSATTGATS